MYRLAERYSARVRASNVAMALVVVVLIAFEVANRRSGLGGRSLYEDDAWVALAGKVEGVDDVFRVGLSAPGFVALVAAWLRTVGFSEFNAQIPAFVFGAVSGPLFLLAAIRMRIRFAPAFLATATLISSPFVVTFSTRVKQYTLEVVLAIVVVYLASRVLDEPESRRRWVAFTATMALSVTCSTALLGVAVSASAAVAMALVHARGVRAACASFEARLLGAAGFFAGGWFVLVVRPRLTPALYAWWDSQMKGVTQATDAGERFRILLPRVFERLFAIDGGVGVAIFVAALVIVGWRSPARAVLFGGPLFVACALFFAGSAPLGTGRTDLWLIGPLAFLLASAIDLALEPAHRWRRKARDRSLRIAAAAVIVTSTVALGAASAVQLARSPEPEQYTGFVASPLIRHFESSRQAGDVIVVAPRLSYVYALYTPYAVTTYAATYRQQSFDVAIADPAVMLWGSYPDPLLLSDTLERLVAGTDTVWVLDNYDPADRIGPSFAGVLTRHGFQNVATKRSALSELQRWDRVGVGGGPDGIAVHAGSPSGG